MAVTDLKSTPGDDGLANGPLGPHHVRQSYTFTATTNLTNLQLFNTDYGVSGEKVDESSGDFILQPPPGLIQDFFFERDRRLSFSDDGQRELAESRGYDSQWLVEKILAHPALFLDNKQPDWKVALDAIVAKGRRWAESRRKVTGSATTAPWWYEPVDHVFYEALGPAPTESEPSELPQQSGPLRYLYKLGAINVRNGGRFSSRRREGWMSVDPAGPPQPAPGTDSSQSRPDLYLSRDPRLTLDAPMRQDNIEMRLEDAASPAPSMEGEDRQEWFDDATPGAFPVPTTEGEGGQSWSDAATLDPDAFTTPSVEGEDDQGWSDVAAPDAPSMFEMPGPAP
jgi:hypothetical protein